MTPRHSEPTATDKGDAPRDRPALTPSAASLAASADLPIRSLEMQLLHEHLARAHSQSVQDQAQRDARVRRFVAAARAQRRAEQASVRARRLLVLAVAG